MQLINSDVPNDADVRVMGLKGMPLGGVTQVARIPTIPDDFRQRVALARRNFEQTREFPSLVEGALILNTRIKHDVLVAFKDAFLSDGLLR